MCTRKRTELHLVVAYIRSGIVVKVSWETAKKKSTDEERQEQ